MESNKVVQDQVEEQTTTNESRHEQVKEEYKDLGEYVGKIEEVPVEKKHVPTFSYGPRIRIAKLYDNYEEFLYKIITVAGWVRTSR